MISHTHIMYSVTLTLLFLFLAHSNIITVDHKLEWGRGLYKCGKGLSRLDP